MARTKTNKPTSHVNHRAYPNFGRLIYTARATPVVVAQHDRPVLAVLSVEEHERLKAIESKKPAA